eukprot:g3757.t1
MEEWFYEKEVMWPGQRFGIKMKKGGMLVDTKSKYQHIQIFDSETYGRVLVLDGVIQLTERDEHAYQEMITHVPMFAHRGPKSVLIIGGGDGGVLREVARHKDVTAISMCEIDEELVNLTKKYFATTTATSFDDKRLTLKFMDAAEYVKDKAKMFDVIIVDSSDPVGPAETLYTSEFYANLQAALRPGGIICTQGECMWLHLKFISRVLSDCAKLFPVVDYCYCSVPSYPSGQIGFILCSNGGVVLNSPCREINASLQNELQYYTPEIHKAAFILPRFCENEISSHRRRFPEAKENATENEENEKSKKKKRKL